MKSFTQRQSVLQVLAETEKLWELGEHQRAIELLEGTLKNNYTKPLKIGFPGDGLYHVMNSLSLFYQMQGRAKEALPLLQEVLSATGTKLNELREQLYLAKNKGIILRTLDIMENPFEESGTNSPNSTQNRPQSATTTRQSKKIDEEAATTDLERVIQTLEERKNLVEELHAVAYHDLARCHDMLEDYITAQDYYKKAIQTLTPKIQFVDYYFELELKSLREFAREQKKKENEKKSKQETEFKSKLIEESSNIEQSHNTTSENKQQKVTTIRQNLQNLVDDMDVLGKYMEKVSNFKNLTSEEIEEIKMKKKRAWQTLTELNEIHKQGEFKTVEKFKTNENSKISKQFEPTVLQTIRPSLSSRFSKMSSSRFNIISRMFNSKPPQPDTYVPQLYGSFHTNLSLLYEYLGNYKEAEKYHNISFKYNPFCGTKFTV